MNVLVINCGSSSLKYQLIDMDNENTLAQGLVERIGLPGSSLVQKVNGNKHKIEAEMHDHKEAMKHVLDLLVDKELKTLMKFQPLDIELFMVEKDI